MVAHSPVTRQTNIVSFLVFNVATAFSLRLLAEIQNHARPKGYKVSICDALMAKRTGAEPVFVEQASAVMLRMPEWNVGGTITLPVREMCQAVWRFLEDRLRENASSLQQIMLFGQLQIRT